jgi:hypothetical protein
MTSLPRTSPGMKARHHPQRTAKDALAPVAGHMALPVALLVTFEAGGGDAL